MYSWCNDYRCWKGMYPTILPPSMGKLVGQIGLFKVGMATGLGEFRPIKLRLKTDPVSFPVRVEGLVYIYIYIYI